MTGKSLRPHAFWVFYFTVACTYEQRLAHIQGVPIWKTRCPAAGHIFCTDARNRKTLEVDCLPLLIHIDPRAPEQ